MKRNVVLQKFLPSVAVLAALLAGCVMGPSRCPPLIKYEREFLARVGQEMSLLPERSALGGMITDYGQLRDACRALELN